METRQCNRCSTPFSCQEDSESVTCAACSLERLAEKHERSATIARERAVEARERQKDPK